MSTNNALENRLIEKVKKLSLEQIQQVEQFIDSLGQQNTEQQLTFISTKLSESVFAKIWDNPEDTDYDNL
jgi:16S rRNA G527 N7-methylase RsmG